MNVLHDWDDDRAADILSGAAKAGRAGATVLVVETVLPTRLLQRGSGELPPRSASS